MFRDRWLITLGAIAAAERRNLSSKKWAAATFLSVFTCGWKSTLVAAIIAAVTLITRNGQVQESDNPSALHFAQTGIG